MTINYIFDEMQQIKENKATKKTKTELASALKGLMRTKPFNKITVSELVEKANINRKTFYYHFDNIYSLLKWMFDEEAVLIFKDITLLDNYSLCSQGTLRRCNEKIVLQGIF